MKDIINTGITGTSSIRTSAGMINCTASGNADKIRCQPSPDIKITPKAFWKDMRMPNPNWNRG